MVEPTAGPSEQVVLVPAESLASEVAAHVAAGWRPVVLVGTDERPRGGGFAVEAVLVSPDAPFLRLRADVGDEQPAFPSIGRHVPAFLWDEREIHDLLGIVPVGHPDPRRLVLHDTYPDGFHPLRFDAPSTVPEGRASTAFRPFAAHGEGVYELPVGPIHAGVIEPGHFRFSAMGETVLHLDARLFFTHRGIEKLVEGRSATAALPIVERSCGVCTVTHATAYSLAVERATATDVPPRAAVLRAVLAELERLYNHVGDLGNMCAGIGFNPGNSQLAWLKERALRFNESVSGHRYLMGVVAPGGLAFDLDADALAALPDLLRAFNVELRAVLAIVDGADAVWDRFRGAGRLTAEQAVTLGTVGPAARAAGIPADLRRDRPTGAYASLDVPVAVADEGDVAARFTIRCEEALTSLRLLADLLTDIPAGDIRADLRPTTAAGASALGWAEGPRGPSWIWLRLRGDGSVDRLHLRSASFANWPSVAAAAADNLVPDFPLINKSFELCYACTDR